MYDIDGNKALSKENIKTWVWSCVGIPMQLTDSSEKLLYSRIKVWNLRRSLRKHLSQHHPCPVPPRGPAPGRGRDRGQDQVDLWPVRPQPGREDHGGGILQGGKIHSRDVRVGGWWMSDRKRGKCEWIIRMRITWSNLDKGLKNLS